MSEGLAPERSPFAGPMAAGPMTAGSVTTRSVTAGSVPEEMERGAPLSEAVGSICVEGSICAEGWLCVEGSICVEATPGIAQTSARTARASDAKTETPKIRAAPQTPRTADDPD